MKRIARTTFPGKYVERNSLRYVAVPVSVVERMGIKDGDYLDVTVSWPVLEEYEIDDLMTPAPVNEKKSMRGKKTENDE